MSKPTTGQTWRVSLVVDGHDCGVWDTRTGGAQSSDSNVYPPGAMAPQVALPPGPPTIDVVTLTRMYDGDRDGPLMPLLVNANTKGKDANCKQRALDGDGNAYGSSFIWTGKFTQVLVPEPDSKSKDASMLQVQITPDGPLVLS